MTLLRQIARGGRCALQLVPPYITTDSPPKFSISFSALTGIAMETQDSGITVKVRGRLEGASPADCEGTKDRATCAASLWG